MTMEQAFDEYHTSMYSREELLNLLTARMVAPTVVPPIRWIHPCFAADAVFSVLAPHNCPICGEKCPDAHREAALERERQAIVEKYATD